MFPMLDFSQSAFTFQLLPHFGTSFTQVGLRHIKYLSLIHIYMTPPFLAVKAE